MDSIGWKRRPFPFCCAAAPFQSKAVGFLCVVAIVSLSQGACPRLLYVIIARVAACCVYSSKAHDTNTTQRGREAGGGAVGCVFGWELFSPRRHIAHRTNTNGRLLHSYTYGRRLAVAKQTAKQTAKETPNSTHFIIHVVWCRRHHRRRRPFAPPRSHRFLAWSPSRSQGRRRCA